MEIIDFFSPDSPTYEDDYHRLIVSGSLYEKQFGKMMLDFLDHMRRATIGPRLFAQRFANELWLYYSSGMDSNTLITATVDSKDYSPIVEGLPLMHYRLTYTLLKQEANDSKRYIELRTREVNTACDFVLEAIRKCKT